MRSYPSLDIYDDQEELSMRKRYYILLTAALCLLLTGCQRGTTADSKFGREKDDPTSTAENSGKTTEEPAVQPTETEASTTEEDTGVPGPRDGDIYSNSPYMFNEYPIQGHFKSGKVVCFDKVAYLAYPDGIYKLGGNTFSYLVEAELNDDTTLCTDGFDLYYINSEGELWRIDVTDDYGRGELLEYGFIEGSYVTGAGKDCIYMRTPDTLDPEYGVLDEWGDVYRFNTQNGQSELLMESAYADCAGGYTYIRRDAMDVSEGDLLIYDYDGNLLVNTSSCINVSAAVGTVWFCTGSINGGFASLYYMSGGVNGYTMLFDSDNEGRYQYGYGVNGFLVSHMFDDGDDLVTEYYDLRTNEYIPEENLRVNDTSVFGGYTLGHHAYYTTYNAVYEENGNGELQLVYQQPDDVWSFMYLSNDCLILDHYDDDSFYELIPLEP